MAWTAASCREPVGVLAADRRDGVSLGVVPELRHRFDSEPGAGRILSASASQSGRPGFGALRRPLGLGRTVLGGAFCSGSDPGSSAFGSSALGRRGPRSHGWLAGALFALVCGPDTRTNRGHERAHPPPLPLPREGAYLPPPALCLY